MMFRRIKVDQNEYIPPFGTAKSLREAQENIAYWRTHQALLTRELGVLKRIDPNNANLKAQQVREHLEYHMAYVTNQLRSAESAKEKLKK